ncbi:MAG: pseudouridine synthase [Nitrospiraceae bacterium]
MGIGTGVTRQRGSGVRGARYGVVKDRTKPNQRVEAEADVNLESRTPNLEPRPAVRLQKVIADSGLSSRRKAEEMIAAGRVTVNGRVVRELGTKVDPARDHVKVDGRHLKPVPPHVFVMLNKPKGCVSSLSDPAGRPTITDLLSGVRLRVFPVGRLDFDSEGLLLLTNDGALAQALLHPRYHVGKTYAIKVKGVLSEDEIASLERGVVLEDGPTGKAIVKKGGKAEKNSWLELTIFEGRKHQVKRMLEAVGHPVLKLTRVRFGPLALGDLQPGRYRYLTDREANTIRDMVKDRLSKGSGYAVWGARSRKKEGRRSPLSSHPAPRTSYPSAKESVC